LRVSVMAGFPEKAGLGKRARILAGDDANAASGLSWQPPVAAVGGRRYCSRLFAFASAGMSR